MTPLTVTVHGTPAPQGSKRGFVNPKTGGVIIADANKNTKPWRHDVTAATLNTIAATDGLWTPGPGPVRVDIMFRLPRLRSHFGTGRNAARLKPGAPTHHAVRPDVDKLARAVLDSLTDAGAILDDSAVAILCTAKVYPQPGETAGATITITPLAAVPAESTPPAPSPADGPDPTTAGTAPAAGMLL